MTHRPLSVCYAVKAVPAFLSSCILVAVPAVLGKTGNCMSLQAANFTTLELLITLNIRLHQPEVQANGDC